MIKLDEAYTKWLCAGCYGKRFISTAVHGITSERTVTVDGGFSSKISVSTDAVHSVCVGPSNIKKKKAGFKREFFNPHGILANGIIDTLEVTFFDATCWGDIIDGNSGEYSFEQKSADSVLYFADLRHNIYVYKEVHREQTIPQSKSTETIGSVLAYAAYDGSEEGAYKRINANDALELKLKKSSSSKLTEDISDKKDDGSSQGYGKQVFTSSSSNTEEFSVASSDRSGLCAETTTGCYRWGDYSVVDEGRPYDPTSPVFTEKIRPDDIFAFVNEWENRDQLTAAGEESFTLTTNPTFEFERMKNGTYPLNVTISIDPLPHGSWCVDANGNRFFSMTAYDGKPYNKVNLVDPASVIPLKEKDVVFYPVSVA